MAHVGVGGSDAGAANVKQVPGVGILVPSPSVLGHQERGDTCSSLQKCIFEFEETSCVKSNSPSDILAVFTTAAAC